MLNPVDPSFEATLRAALPPLAFRAVSATYLEEPRGRYSGQAGLVVAPESAEQVSILLRACNAARVGVVPFAGGTGLVGGQILPDGPAPVVLSLERMTKIDNVYPEENALVTQAGAIVADVQAAAAAQDRLFALSLASEGSARIGGVMGTNAGGLNVLRYGNMRDQVLGLRAVLADGTIFDGLTRLRKDNTGYDLRNLLIGSEGTLGVITDAALKLHPRPAAEGTALMVVNSPADALSLLSLAREHIGEGISAFELMGRQALRFIQETLPELRQPFATHPDWFVLIDLGLGHGRNPADELEALFLQAHQAGLVSDGLIAQSEAQRRDFWNLRENIPTANRLIGAVQSHDISLPLGAIPEFVERGRAVVGQIGPFRINSFGHLGDGNLHYNVFPPKGEKREAYDHLRGQVTTCVHDLVHAMGGSVSAEHGIGRLKAGDLQKYGDPGKLHAMRAIKTALDPNGILNPGALFPRP